MATISTNLAPNGANVYGSNSNSNLYTTIPWIFLVSSVAAQSTLTAQQLQDGVDSYVIFQVSTSDGSSLQRKIDMTQTSRQYYSVGLTVNVPAYGYVHLDAQYVNAQVFWGSVTADLAGGWTGNSSTRSNVGFFDTNFTITYDPVWTLDAQNDGYARIAAYDVIEFDKFAKDEFGYPTNWGVWKLDNSNDGYPWPTGYEDAIIRGLPVKIKSNGVWMPVLTKIFSADSLSIVFLKTMEGVPPNED